MENIINKPVAEKIDSIKGSIDNLRVDLAYLISQVENNQNFNKEKGSDYAKKSINEHLKVALQDLENSFGALSEIDLEDKEI